MGGYLLTELRVREVRMVKNVVHFQNGLSKEARRSQDGTVEQCQMSMFCWRWPWGLGCQKRAAIQLIMKAHPISECITCRHGASLIARWLFHSTKLPLTKCPAHQLAPDRHPGTVARLGGIGVFAIASLSRDHGGRVVAPGPINVGELAKPAIGQIPG